LRHGGGMLGFSYGDPAMAGLQQKKITYENNRNMSWLDHITIRTNGAADGANPGHRHARGWD